MAIPKAVLHFIAGGDFSAVLARVKLLNKQGIKALIDLLGEELHDREEVEKVVQEYKKLISEIKKKKLNAAIDLKLTNIGLCISKDYCLHNLIEILSYAKLANVQVWIDAEQHKYRVPTTQLYLRIHKKFENVFLTVQAYTKDSYDYLEKLIQQGAKIRLVKGAYKEKFVFKSKETVRKQFSKLMRHLFVTSDHFAIATHDEILLSEALKLQELYHKQIEFQLLMGLSEKFMAQLKRFDNVAEYVPYGTDWKGYYERRLAYLKQRTGRQ